MAIIGRSSGSHRLRQPRLAPVAGCAMRGRTRDSGRASITAPAISRAIQGPRASITGGALRVTPKVRSSQPTASCRLAWLNSTLACSTWGLTAARRPLPAAGSP